MARPEGKTNVAIRLTHILQRAKTLKTTGHWTYRRAWCAVFEIDEYSSELAMFTLLDRLAQLRRLFEEVMAALATMPDLDPSLFVTPIKSMSAIVNDFTVLDQPWPNYSGILSIENMTALGFIEDLISKHEAFNEPLISLDEIASIHDDIENLFDKIGNSSIDAEAKQILRRLLIELRKALAEYEIGGSARIKSAFGTAFGLMALHHDKLEELKDTEEVKGLYALLGRIKGEYERVTNKTVLNQATAVILPMLTDGKARRA